MNASLGPVTTGAHQRLTGHYGLTRERMAEQRAQSHR